MDPALQALLAFAAANREAPAANHEVRQAQRARARTARDGKRSKTLAEKLEEATNRQGQLSNELATCLTLSDACRRILPVGTKHKFTDRQMQEFVRMWSYQRLACSSRLKGTAGEKQAMAQQFIASAALHLQGRWWKQCVAVATLSRAQGGRSNGQGAELAVSTLEASRFLGLRVVWDEAGHKMRPLLKQTSQPSVAACDPRASAVVQVLTATCDVFSVCCVSDASTNRSVSLDRWEPWLCPPRPLLSTSADFILHALLTMLPFPVDERPALESVLNACDVLFVVFLCDSASGNLRACRYLLHIARQVGFRVIFHIEVCSIHQTHIIRSASYDLVGCAGILYSLSKVLRISSSLDALRLCLMVAVKRLVKFRLCDKSSRAPSVFGNVVKTIFGIDGTESFLFKKDADGNLQPKAFFTTLLNMTQDIEFLPDGTIMVLFDNDPLHRGMPSSRLLQAAVDVVMAPVMKLFINRVWNTAALSRWTHITETLKRVTLGCAMGRLLRTALAGMSGQLNLDEHTINAALAKAAAAEERGEDPGVQQAWARHGKRVLKISTYFATPGRSVVLGCLLISLAVVDQLHHSIIGHGRENRATLWTMAHPFYSVVGVALQRVLSLMEVWFVGVGSPWHLLNWLGFGTCDHYQIRLLCRRILIRVSCGVFRRLEIRFAGLPYRLLWLLLVTATPDQGLDENRPTDDDIISVCRSLLDADEHCLPLAALHFRSYFPTVAAMRGPKARAAVRTLSNALGFSTDEVERENRHVSRGVQSQGQARQHSSVVNGELCRKLREVHMMKGGADPGTSRATPSIVDGASGSSPSSFLDPPSAPVVPSASAGSPASVALSPVRRAALALRKIQSKKGNPKLCYINNMMSAEAADGARTKAQWCAARKKWGEKYDAVTLDDKTRWRRIFQSQGVQRLQNPFGRSRRVRRLHGKHKAVVTVLATSKPIAFQPLWHSCQLAGQHIKTPAKGLPINEHTLMNIFNDLYQGKVQELYKATGGKSKHSLDGNVPRRTAVLDLITNDADFIRLWGCSSCWANVCKKLKTSLFYAITIRLSKWVDQLGDRRDLVEDGLVLLGREEAGGIITRVLFVLLGLPIMNPKVQVFIACVPDVGSSTDTGIFRGAVPELPVELKFSTKPSLLCCPSRAGFRTLYHLTSDDLALLLVQSGLQHWSARHIAPRLKDCRNLMEMVLEDFKSDEFVVSAKPKRENKKNGDAQAPSWLSKHALSCLTLSDPLDQGRAQAETLRKGSAGGGGPSIAASSPMALCLEQDDMSLFDCFPAHICEELADLVLDAKVVDAGGVVAGGPGEEEEEEEKTEGPPPHDPAEPEADELDELAAEAVEVDQIESLEDVMHDYELKDDNKLVHRMSPDDPIGTVTVFTGGKNICGVCWKHTKCRLLKSTKNVSKNMMVRWLIAGKVLPTGTPAAVWIAEGEEHRRAFGRMAPIP